MSEEQTSWHGYPSIFALGHRVLGELFSDPVLIEEKIDGSQFSFGLFSDGYRARSKGCQLNIAAPEKMFARAVDFIQTLPLREGWTYRGEWLSKPKHNTLAYERAPKNGIIVFDINDGHESYLAFDGKAEEAARLGLEIVPRMFSGIVSDKQMFAAFLESDSCLGGQKVEGVVIKNYTRFGPDKKALMGKYVSERFKEKHSLEWKDSNPTSKDILARLAEGLTTPARWQKAVQHMSEAGKLEQSPRDIGALMKEVPTDIEKECIEEIKSKLFEWAWPHIRRRVTRGLPEWYKEQLLAKQFQREEL